ncbi:MAG: hypothetical protein M5U19_23470 [Microthrixaceae bacterium]|nr:hypothetical protein [Microthrixaceae bacterium]
MNPAGPTAEEVTGTALLELLSGFIVELREAGLPVSLTENLDAMAAVQAIPIEDRSAFKYALAATLVKNHAHWRAFETVFEVYFSHRGSHYAIGEDGGARPVGPRRSRRHGRGRPGRRLRPGSGPGWGR